ncbi:hypothetical protein K0B04_02275, partial [Patescibacteria group bacterium]|nr:hypothetical protein [Patescibacteria group bacterium]
MRKELKITIGILFLSSLLFVALNIVQNIEIDGGHNILSPFSKGKNVLSYFSRKNEKPKKIVYGYLPWWSLEKVKYLQLNNLTDIAYFGLYLDSDGNFVETTEGEEGSTIPESGYYHWKNSQILENLIIDCKKENVRFALTIIAHIDDK